MIDPASIATAVIASVTTSSLTAIAKFTGTKTTEIRGQFTKTFEPHLKKMYEKCSKVKTIFTDDKYVPLSDLYINLYLSDGTTKIRDEDLISESYPDHNIVIRGTGGAGKTMLMKNLALQKLTSPSGKIPIYIELRTLRLEAKGGFYEDIFQHVTPKRLHRRYKSFEAGLEAGIFTILFDGLDEVGPEYRDEIYHRIQRFSIDYPSVRVIASTRPEIDTRNWDELRTLDVQGMALAQARMLVKKTGFDVDLRNEFLNLLDEQFFDRHKSFLEIPLLCSLMLLTYDEFRVVPTRLTLFYEQAFETLFRRHDRLKEGNFNRPFKSQLPSDRFKAIFAAFCYRTLAFSQVSFTDDQLQRHIRAALNECEIDVSVDDYASDLVSAVCMIMRDGKLLYFIHRSFQEYFAAIYILRYRGTQSFKVCNQVIGSIIFNDLPAMAYDMEPRTFEREWVAPALDEMSRFFKKYPKKTRPLRFLENYCLTLNSHGTPPTTLGTYSWTAGQNYHRWIIEFRKIYPREFHFPSLINQKIKSSYSSLCEIDQSISPPRIREACGDDTYEETDSGLEIPVGSISPEWLEETGLAGRINEGLEKLFAFNKIVNARVKKRESVSILD
ncbi:MAG: hypothetical protein ABJ205_13760 [Erythrobacter sp.]|uniref:NACHT domain-containing protein n=1 Tax=Erythrobacter sp. TaxID=1042 RepID=UPI0032640033